MNQHRLDLPALMPHQLLSFLDCTSRLRVSFGVVDLHLLSTLAARCASARDVEYASPKGSGVKLRRYEHLQSYARQSGDGHFESAQGLREPIRPKRPRAEQTDVSPSNRMEKKAFRKTKQNFATMLQDGTVILPLAQQSARRECCDIGSASQLLVCSIKLESA